MFLLWIIIPLFILYSILIIYFWLSWRSIPEFILPAGPASTKISVIIPARNEEANIGVLLQALQQQTYPRELFEVIVVDDHSEDDTVAVVKQFKEVKLLSVASNNINSFKKKAIETGITAATNELIVTTDADCRAPADWLQTIAGFKEY